MNIWPLVLLATAIQASTPFHWEFDLKQCDYYGNRYSCFAPMNGHLVGIEREPSKRFDYQMHPHVLAIKAQSSDRWLVAMQSRSRKQKVDLDFGMILHRLPDNQNEEKFLECRVANGKVEVKSSADIETDLIDSYFDEHHLYCDFIVKSKKPSGKAITDIVSQKDKFGLSVSMDGKAEKYIDGLNRDEYIYDEHKFISTYIHTFKNHECDLSKAKFDPKDAPKGGKLRSWEVFGNELRCPDNRYKIQVTDDKGWWLNDARIECKDGKYQVSEGYSPRWNLKSSDTLNAYCYIYDKQLCPISIPCDKESCAYIKVGSIDHEYDVHCDHEQDPEKSVIVVGERDYAFTLSGVQTHCDDKHNLVVKNFHWYKDRHYKSPPTIATEAFCAKEHSVFGYKSNCMKRDPLCNGKSCSITPNDVPSVYDVTCTNPNHMFQQFNLNEKAWNTHAKKLYCKGNGEWDRDSIHHLRYPQYARCKDPADSNPPAEFIADQKKEKSVQPAANKEKPAEAVKPAANREKPSEAVANAQSIAVFPIALTFALSIFNAL